jgi:hypothetical protein
MRLEAEESVLLEAVKTGEDTEDWKDLACAGVINDGTVINCSHKACVKVVNKSNL